MAGLAWVFGLRHAVDADHIAAIDNAVRKLAGEHREARLTGLFFSLGHSTIVVILAAVAALAAGLLQGRMHDIERIGTYVGTLISVAFLAIIAVGNMLALRGTHAHAGPTGVMSRLLRPVLNRVGRSRDMYPVGVLFGLGFDTATEIGLLALSAAGSAHGLAFWRSMAFPALFTAGMSLIDTGDSIMMTGAYAWAMRDGGRRATYNLVLTMLSVVIAMLIGAIELLGLFNGSGAIWHLVAWLNEHWSELGGAIVVTLALVFLVSLRRSGNAHAR
jgi:high-affinity nickel-transport protein